MALVLVVFGLLGPLGLLIILASPRTVDAEPWDPTQNCFAADVSGDYRIDIVDAQIIAWNYGASLGMFRFDPKYDPHPPPAGDGDTDIVDLQFVFGRNGGVCEIVKSHSEQFGWSTDGTYWNNVTITGHATSTIPLGFRVFDVNSPHSRGVETCINALGFGGDTTDWDYFGQLDPQQSPYTLYASGTHATGFFDCLGGHAIWGHAWYTWMNAAYPTLNETQPTGAGGATFGYVGCFMLTPPDFCGPFGS